MTLSTDPAYDELLDHVRELTQTHAHREHYTRDAPTGGYRIGRDHVTQVPSLIWQLEHASPSGEGLDRNTGYKSKPAARVEALDTLVSIDLEASRWVRELGEDDPTSTAGCISRLHGLMASMDRCHRRAARRDKETGKVTCCAWHAAAVDVRRWWTQARIVTGWDSPAWRPDNTCPNCDARGKLRVRLNDSTAMCTECRETWDRATIGLLAEHIRAENNEQAAS